MEQQKLDPHEALRHAGLCATFMWQDDTAEGHMDGDAEVDYASVIGTLPEEVNGSPVFIVHIDGTATSTFGYSYPVERDVKVSLQENGKPLVGEASDEEIAQAEQHVRDQACQEYGSLMYIVQVGAYSESSEDGSYWYEGENISQRLLKLESAALAAGFHFAGTGKEGYILEPATKAELDAYEKAQEDQDEDE